jgi:4-amino-4-deoxy-L-arabinose transferase-like glycosyltransferase
MAATLAFFGHAFVAQLHQPLGHDVAWLFFVAKNLVAGERQYGDIAEENPPLILWLYSVPAWFASALDLSGIVCLRLFILLAAALFLYLTNRVLEQLFDPESSVCRHVLIAALGYLLTVFPDASFSQREHLIAMCLAPYTAAVAVRLCRGCRDSIDPLLAILVGISAGLAVSLKPVFLVAILLPEIGLLWKERSHGFSLSRDRAATSPI